jgi:Ras-related GTP-binding protein C/D
VVYVIDAQEDLRRNTIQEVCAAFEKAKSLNPNVVLQVFVNKVDGDTFASEELRVEVQHLFQSQLNQELGKDDFSVHLTSVYNPSVYEAWSLLIQKLIPNQAGVVELLDALVEACRMEKAFLFDVRTRLYLATDHNPVDHQTLTLCADSIDLASGFDSVYGPSVNVFDAESGSVSAKVRLSNNMVLLAQQVGKSLALVCVARKESWTDPWAIERNVQLFRDSLNEIKALRDE